jgi:hypothetical protein
MRFTNKKIFIYCGGKCGSGTLEKTFINNGFNTLRLHNNSEFKKNYNSNINIYKIIKNNSINRKVYIIDSYRTPIERKISSFFENISKHVPDYNLIDIKSLINIFNNKYLKNIEEYHSINEVMLHFNVPLFNEFNFEKKYNIEEKDNIIFIKIRFKNIDEWSSILGKIFNKEIILHNHNLSVNKEIYNLYEKFKEEYKVPLSYLYNIDKDREFKIFTSKNEKIEYLKYWINKSYDDTNITSKFT